MVEELANATKAFAEVYDSEVLGKKAGEALGKFPYQKPAGPSDVQEGSLTESLDVGDLPTKMAVQKDKPKPILEQFAEVENSLAKAKAEVAIFEALKTKLMPFVLEWMANNGVTQSRVDKLGRTVYVAREIWAGKAEGTTATEFVNAMHALGYEEFDAVGHQRLSAFVRELLGDNKEPGEDEQGDPISFEEHIKAFLPAEMLEHIRVTSVQKVRSRKVTKK